MEGWETQIDATHSDVLVRFCTVSCFSRCAGGYCFLGFIAVQNVNVRSAVLEKCTFVIE